MFDRIVNKIAFGLGMAMVYSLLFLWIGYIKGMETVETKTLIMYLVTANIVGLIFSFASFIFEKEEWSILKQTMTHFIVLLGTFLPTAIWIGWVPNRFGPILVCIGSFIVIYFIIWLMMMLYWKRKIEKLNHQLR
ncbi:permease [Bacillus thuringiensis]|nr:permease [Bacillus thuringiensis]